MFSPVTWRALARPATAIGTAIAILALASAAHAWAGSGGIGDEPVPPNPTDPTDPADPDDGVFPLIVNHTYGDGFGASSDHEGQTCPPSAARRSFGAEGRSDVDYHSAAGNTSSSTAGPLLDSRRRAPPRIARRCARARRSTPARRSAASAIPERDTRHLHFQMWSNRVTTRAARQGPDGRSRPGTGQALAQSRPGSTALARPDHPLGDWR